VTTLGAYSIMMTVLLGVLVGVGFLLSRYRDRLNSYFGPRARITRASVDVAPGARLTVVEIDGMTVVCGINRSGITALQVVQAAPHGRAS
jgi:flagellar biogenesis protein FliO